MGFFRTTFTLCTRISALTQLIKCSPWRVVWHVVLLLIFCPAIGAALSVFRAKSDLRQTLDSFDRETGGIVLENGKIAMGSGAAEKHLSFTLFQLIHARVDFIQKEQIKTLDPDPWKETIGIVFTPTAAHFWTRAGEGKYTGFAVSSANLIRCVIQRKPDDDLTQTMRQQMLYSSDFLTADGLRKNLEDFGSQSEASAENTAKIVIWAKDLYLWFAITYWVACFIAFLNECLFLVVISGLCFGAVQYFRCRSLRVHLPFKTMVGLAFYATFPAFVIATIFKGIGIDVPSFQTVFFIVFFIYQLMSFNYLIRWLNPDLPGPEDHDGDDDF